MSARHAIAEDHAGRPGSYIPPADIKETDLVQLLKHVHRTVTHKQLDFLSSKTQAETETAKRIFYSGDISLLDQPCVAIVGTRKVSDDGARRARRLARELAQAGVVVVSGLAAGVDTCALSSAIESGGRTAAVIGTPLDKAYPAENKRLQEEIYRDHLLISQFEIGERTYRSSFPLRNKLMATISDATVVVEASDTSGTLHQAAECTRLGRWLFIARSVVEDPGLSWPKKFLDDPHCVILKETSDIVDRVKGSRSE